MGIYDDMNVKKLNKSQEAEQKSSRRNPKKSTPGHSIIKLLTPKDKEKNLASKET